MPWTCNEHVSQVRPCGTFAFLMLCLCSSCSLYLDTPPTGPILLKPSLIKAPMPNDLTRWVGEPCFITHLETNNMRSFECVFLCFLHLEIAQKLSQEEEYVLCVLIWCRDYLGCDKMTHHRFLLRLPSLQPPQVYGEEHKGGKWIPNERMEEKGKSVPKRTSWFLGAKIRTMAI